MCFCFPPVPEGKEVSVIERVVWWVGRWGEEGLIFVLELEFEGGLEEERMGRGRSERWEDISWMVRRSELVVEEVGCCSCEAEVWEACTVGGRGECANRT